MISLWLNRPDERSSRLRGSHRESEEYFEDALDAGVWEKDQLPRERRV